MPTLSHETRKLLFQRQILSVAVVVLCFVLSGCPSNVGNPSNQANTNPKNRAGEKSERVTAQKPAANPDAKKKVADRQVNPLRNPNRERATGNRLRNGNDTPRTPRGQQVAAKKAPVLARNGKTYRPAQVNKANTLMVLAAQPDIRADYLIMNTREYMTEDQIDPARAIAMEYMPEFDDILKRRSETLATGAEREDLKGDLLMLRMDTADLIQKVRSQIHREILTREQKEVIRQKYAHLQTQ